MFELNQLEQLIAIAECQTISAAAERLHLSQPALSRSIQKLEAALQVTLFDREKKQDHPERKRKNRRGIRTPCAGTGKRHDRAAAGA